MPGHVEWTVRGEQCYQLDICSDVSTFAVAHSIRLLASDPSSASACLRVVLKLPCTRPFQELRQRTAFANDEPLILLVIEPRGILNVS